LELAVVPEVVVVAALVLEVEVVPEAAQATSAKPAPATRTTKITTSRLILLTLRPRSDRITGRLPTT
jgi:hypothetical protein